VKLAPDAAPKLSPSPSPNGGRSKGLPVYVAVDTSSSMSPHERLLNETLAAICDTLITSPKVSEFIHLSIVSFNTAPHLVIGMTEMARLTALPTVSCNGLTNYAPMFQLLRDRIEIDIPTLSSAGVRVLRPAVFLLTDGAPTDPGDVWERSLSELTDPEWKLHPHTITYGFGSSSERVLKRVSTLAAYLADDDKTASNREALAAALTSLLNTLVASAQAERLLIPEEVKGYKSVTLDYVDE
jgi:uncharacterized protein YegL